VELRRWRLADSEKTMILRRLVLILVGSVIALPALGVAALLVELSYTPAYDQSDLDYQRYSDAFDRLRLQIDSRGTTKEDVIDLSQLNKGEWKMACVFGGYTKPVEKMRELGANINEKDQVRMTEAESRGFRLGQVEEFEMAIAYFDLNSNAQFIHVESGIGPEGQYFQKCISKPETRLFVLGP
jgi:hypothetical protein